MKLALIKTKDEYMTSSKLFADYFEKAEEFPVFKDVWRSPSLGLLTIAGLSYPDFEITYIDENFDNINYDEKYDIVGLGAMTHQVNRAYKIADKFRARNIPVVMGGIHATVKPEEVKEHVDSVIVGEAETLWPKFLNDFMENRITDIYSEEIYQNNNLSKSPIPKYDILPCPERYKTIPAQTTRGCPHDCEFCSATAVYGKKLRYKDIDQVVEELRLIKSIWKKPEIFFVDDNIFANRKHAKKLLRSIIPLKLRWWSKSDISFYKDEELLELVLESGCMRLIIGFESISGDNLNRLDRSNWKLKQLDKYAEAIEKIQSYGIGIIGAFILGMDNDDKTSFEKTRDFIVDNYLYGAQLTLMTPLPGTRLYERLKSEGRILTPDWNYYSLFDVIYQPKHMSAKELEEGHHWLYQQIHNREMIKRRTKHFKEIIKSNLDKKTEVKS